MKSNSRSAGELLPIDGIVTPRMRRRLVGPTPIQSRLIETAARCAQEQEDQSILYQHSVFCQTCLPYRDPGDDVRVWERSNGRAHLKVLAGEAMHPREGRFVELGLPFGPKSRMILMHINQRALLAQSPVIEVEDSLTRFVGKVLNLDLKGRNIKAVKDQLARLCGLDPPGGRARWSSDNGQLKHCVGLRPLVSQGRTPTCSLALHGFAFARLLPEPDEPGGAGG